MKFKIIYLETFFAYIKQKKNLNYKYKTLKLEYMN